MTDLEERPQKQWKDTREFLASHELRPLHRRHFCRNGFHSSRNVRDESKKKTWLVITHAFLQRKYTKMNEVVTSLLPRDHQSWFREIWTNGGKVSTRREREKIFEIREDIQHFFFFLKYPRFSKSKRGDLESRWCEVLEIRCKKSGESRAARRRSHDRNPRAQGWRENREISGPSLPRREIIRFSLSLSLSRSKLHLAASLSRRYYVYNALGFRKKKANRRGPRGVARPWGIRIVDGAWRGPGEARRRSENAFAERLVGGMSIETTGTRQFTFLRPFATRYPPRVPL